MPRPLIPPDYVNASSEKVYDISMPDGAARTYYQLLGLAYKSKGKGSTPSLSMDQIMALTGKKQSTVYGHMTLLRDRSWLQFSTAQDGTFVFTFPEDLERSRKIEQSNTYLTTINSDDLSVSQNPALGEAKAVAPFQKNRKPKEGKADPRTSLPAIQCVKGITSRYPPKELYDDIIQLLGESPNGQLLATCRKEWLRRGYNPGGWPWLFDWYPAGGPPGRNVNGRAPAQESALDRISRRIENGEEI